MAAAGDRQETHFWTDGKEWHVYSERPGDIRRFSEWLGAPTRTGRGGETAWWDNIPQEALKVRPKSKASRSPAQVEAARKAGERFRAMQKDGTKETP